MWAGARSSWRAQRKRIIRGSALLLLVLGCDRSEPLELDSFELEPVPTPVPTMSATVPAVCPADMLLVDGNYCPDVEQHCLKKESGDRCLRYAEPSVCKGKRNAMRFCIDRYEWPNKKAAIPMVLVSWPEALEMCKDIGKRLCTVEEFNFACEGEAMLPYTYGYERDKTKCNIDKPYRQRRIRLSKYEKCIADPRCRDELERLDQREPAGSRAGCVSPFGVHDLNGNVNEWVYRTEQRHPNRSGLKSGWWGPIRSRCRPTTGFHKEGDWGYEAGFRCCRDAD
jgi:formylglycine-generating enzyme required for sulfatase activity